MPKTALIAGASGLIGSFLLSDLLSSARYQKIIVLSRKPAGITDGKVQEIITDITSLEQHKAELKADDVFCCLGTTMANAGSKEKFYEVDFTYPHKLAEYVKENGANQFLIITALGAKKNSWVYYNRVKGEIEDAIKKIDFESTHIFRPSLLLGPRQEQRKGEDAAKRLYKYLDWLIPSNYKAIEAEKVARAMLHYATQEKKGLYIHESKILQKF